MTVDLALVLLGDAVFAAVAASGFAMISNPPVRAVVFAALLAAIGHAGRLYILDQQWLTTIPATFCAAVLIGLLSIFIARFSRHPIEVFSFPALLPMIPGIPAYQTVLSIFEFMNSKDPAKKALLLVDIVDHGAQMLFLLLALVVGVCLPMLLFLTSLFRHKPAMDGSQSPTPPVGHVEFSFRTKLPHFESDHQT